MEGGKIEDLQSLMFDGNAIVGLLHELFATEMTIAPVECATCGRVGQMGSLWVFVESPGYVLRCPGCQNVVLRITVEPDQIYLDARGTLYLQIPKKRT
jgi:hypothetical protein